MKKIKFDYIFYLLLVLLLLCFAGAARAQTEQDVSPQIAATGGNFTLEKAVLAGGGNQTAQQPFNLGGTSGQTVAGSRSTGGSFSLYSGFWTPENNFVPTAATITISGRVITPRDLGLTNALVTLTDTQGAARTVRTGKGGTFRFAEITAGETVILTVSSKRYTYAPQIIIPIEDIADIIFTAF